MEKLIVIVGPTGVGKTSLSVDIAKRCNGEIISGDAYQIYKELDIGTAKVKEEETQGIQHYLVDKLSMNDEYNVKIFQERGRTYIQEIIKKGKVPIICGGTGLYIKALLYDYVFNEEIVDSSYLKTLEVLSNEQLYLQLKQIDEKACESIHLNNRKRIIRALMMAHSGEKKSERIEKQQHKLLYNVYLIGLTMEREQLYERINQRVDSMMREGLYDEVMKLAKKQKTFSLPSMRAIGYKEWEDHFFGNATRENVIEKIKKNSRNFAKRQYTWFNHQMEVHWYDVFKTEEREKIVKECEVFLRSTQEHD